MKKTLFIKNAAIMTASALILRFAGIIFKVWLAALIGSEGIGLYQLIFSVYVLVSTFATSGISTAVTRLVTEETALGSAKGTVRILKRSIELTLIIAFVSLGAVYLFSDFIATRLLGDSRAALALKILPLSLPFMGVCSCMRGYFIARRKAAPSSVSSVVEQAVRIVTVVLLVKRFVKSGLSVCCAAVMAGDVISEFAALGILFFAYKADKKRLSTLSGRENPPFSVFRRIIEISVPISSGRYLNSLLRTAENLLVPKNLARYGNVGKNALSQFGMIKGMALPILFFPSTVLNSVSTLLIPEMSEAAALKRNALVKAATEDILKLTAIIAFVFAAIFSAGGERIGILIYGDSDVGALLKVLAPIVPFMYLDSISDGILKGLDQQKFTFRTCISDSTIRIILILLLLPVSGLKGFIGIMYFSNLFTCLLNVGRLIKITKAEVKSVSDILFPLLSAAAITMFTNSLLRIIGIKADLVYIILLCCAVIPSYFIVLMISGCITEDEIKNVVKN